MSDPFQRYLNSLLKETGFKDTPAGDALEDWMAPIENCPACGESMDYCQGHGETGDPTGFKVLQQHYDGEDHSSCNPRGCEEAGQL